MKIEKIYFDLDGVLADFERGVRELCGMEAPKQGVRRKAGADDAMWEAIREIGDFYGRLELVPGAKEMFDALYARYGNRCEVLTGVPKPRRQILTAGEDKIHWVHRHLAKDLVVHITYRQEKPNYCKGEGYVLLDDHPKTISNWERSGGTGILFTSSEAAMGRLRELGIL